MARTLTAATIVLCLLGIVDARPNVLLLVVDDLRPALGSYGYPGVLSPNIDQMAAQSVVFNNAYVQQALCGPSRTSFLTSRRPDTTKLYDFGSYWRASAGNYTTLPQHFKENGYFTYSIGKVFHHGKCSNGTDDYPYSWSLPAYHPPTQAYMNSAVCPVPDGSLRKNVLCPVNVSTQPGRSLPDIESSEQAVKILKNLTNARMKKPFFLAVGFHKPHIPFKFPEEYLKLYPISGIGLAPDPYVPENLPPVAFSPWTHIRTLDDMKALNLSFPYGPIPAYFQRKIRQHYYASMTFTDALVGKVLNQLQKSGFSDNTIVVLFADHGWSLGEHGEWVKQENFEVVTRVPLIVHVPGITHHKPDFSFLNAFEGKASPQTIKPRSEALVELVDVFPTLSELAGLPIPKMCPPNSFKVQLCTEGLSFAPLITGEDSRGMGRSGWKSAAFSQYPRPSDFPQKDSEDPLLKNIKIMGYTMRTRLYRYTEWVGFDHLRFHANFSEVHARELYLHESDPGENNNVAEDVTYKGLVGLLRKKLIAGWRHASPK